MTHVKCLCVPEWYKCYNSWNLKEGNTGNLLLRGVLFLCWKPDWNDSDGVLLNCGATNLLPDFEQKEKVVEQQNICRTVGVTTKSPVSNCSRGRDSNSAIRGGLKWNPNLADTLRHLILHISLFLCLDFLVHESTDDGPPGSGSAGSFYLLETI